MTERLDYFAKLPSNFLRIPESRYFMQSAAGDIYYFLLDMVYRKEDPAYQNKAHTPTVRMAENYAKGYIACWSTVREIMNYRGYTINTVKDALRTLAKLGLIQFETPLEEGQEPFDSEGMIYRVGVRLRDKNGRLTGETEHYLEQISLQASTLEGATRIQTILIRNFKPGAKPMNINNIRFEGVTPKTVKATKQPKAGKNQPPRQKVATVEEQEWTLDDEIEYGDLVPEDLPPVLTWDSAAD